MFHYMYLSVIGPDLTTPEPGPGAPKNTHATECVVETMMTSSELLQSPYHVRRDLVGMGSDGID